LLKLFESIFGGITGKSNVKGGGGLLDLGKISVFFFLNNG
jgi:hypothetical protein